MQGRTGVQKQTKALILEAALDVVGREGIEGLTIGTLATAVGMSKSGLFAHFRSRDALQLDVLRAATDRFVDVVLRPAFREPRGERRLHALVDNWLRYLGGPGSVLIAASSELDDRPGRLRAFVGGAQRDLIANVEQAVRIAVEVGDFREDLDVELFAWSLYSFILGYHHSKRLLKDPKAEEHMRRSFEGLLRVARAENKKRKIS